MNHIHRIAFHNRSSMKMSKSRKPMQNLLYLRGLHIKDEPQHATDLSKSLLEEAHLAILEITV